jgi:hypothetical protein
MKYTKNRYYHSMSDFNNDLDKTKCPITGNILNDDFIEFQINGKIIRVCSHNCMIKIKNLYNYLK